MNTSVNVSGADQLEGQIGVNAGKVLHLVLSFVGTLGNSLVVWCVLRSPQMRTPIHICFASLAVADCLVCATMSMVVYFDDFSSLIETPLYKRWACLGILSFGLQCLLASVLGILVVSLKRWLQIIHWNTCSIANRMKGAMVMVAIAWLCSSLMGVSVAIWRKPGPYSSCYLDFCLTDAHQLVIKVILLFAIAAIVFLCGSLLRHTVKRLQAVHAVAGETVDSLERARQEDRRIHNTIVMLIAVLMSLWLPHIIITIIPRTRDAIDQYNLRIWSLAMLQLNSLVNPFIYVWRSRSFRDALFALIPNRECLQGTTPNLQRFHCCQRDGSRCCTGGCSQCYTVSVHSEIVIQVQRY